MINTLRAEWIKWSRLPVFWYGLATYAVLMFGGFWLLENILGNLQGQSGLDIKDTLSSEQFLDALLWCASFLHLMLGAIAIYPIALEYQNRTFRQQVMQGNSYTSMILGKVAFCFCLALFSFLLVTLLILWLQRPNFDLSTFPLVQSAKFFLQANGFMAMACFLAFLIRKQLVAMVVFLILGTLGEAIIGLIIGSMGMEKVYDYMPFNIMGSILKNPLQDMTPTGQPVMETGLDPNMTLAIGFGYMVLAWAFSYMLLAYRDK